MAGSPCEATQIGLTVNGMWWTYVTEITAGATLESIARQVNVSQGTVSRWQASTPKPGTVAAFAKAYGRPVLEAFVAAGFLTPEEASEQPSQRHPITTYDDDELVEDILRRLHERDGTDASTAGAAKKMHKAVVETAPSITISRQPEQEPDSQPAPGRHDPGPSR